MLIIVDSLQKPTKEQMRKLGITYKVYNNVITGSHIFYEINENYEKFVLFYLCEKGPSWKSQKWIIKAEHELIGIISHIAYNF